MQTPLPASRMHVPETCFKEVMSCEVSLLGFHLPISIKEKIWRGDFIDVLSLLPSVKEFTIESEKKAGHKTDDKRCRPIPRAFLNCCRVFAFFFFKYKHPHLFSELFQHVENVLESYKNLGGFRWLNYDGSFRQKLAIHPSLK